jgi:hypothetical protein
MVELCPHRAAALRNGATASLPTLPFDIPGLAQLARQFAFANGRDMRAALESADACRARVHCGDLLQVPPLFLPFRIHAVSLFLK